MNEQQKNGHNAQRIFKLRFTSLLKFKSTITWPKNSNNSGTKCEI